MKFNEVFEKLKSHRNYSLYLNHNPKVLIFVVELTKFLDDCYKKVSHKQRCWHIFNKKLKLEQCVCGNHAKWTKNKLYVSCSQKCKQLVIKKNTLKKYGVDNVMKLESIKKKVAKTNLKKYGAKTNLLVQDNPMHDEKIKKIVHKKLSIKKEKIRKKLISKYGRLSENEKQKLIDKQKTSMFNNHGVYNPMHIPRIKNYNSKKRFITANNKLGDSYQLISINDNNNTYTINHKKCKSIFNINFYTINHRLDYDIEICHICHPLNKKWSKYETEIVKYLKSNDVFCIGFNTKNIIKPLEIDIYLPKFKLAVEFNGLYWHSEVYKERLYHQHKWKRCIEKNIELMQIWEHDWIFRKNIVLSILNQKIGQGINKIGARKCSIVKLSTVECRKFLDDNHLQGFVSASVYYGLTYNNKLTQIMSFTHIGNKWEISRLCTSMNTIILGGSNRLYKKFLDEHDPEYVYTYSDISYFSGGVYEKLGFELEKTTVPNYLWFKSLNKLLSRQQCQKHKLIKQGFDPQLSESEIMRKRGYVKVYGSGNQKWVFQR